MSTEMQKNEKRPPKSSKNKMFIFGLHSISDDWLSDLSDERWPKCKKMKTGPLSHQKLKCSFLDYIQLLMISRAMNVDWNTKKQKGPLSHQKIKCSLFDNIQLLMIGWAMNATETNEKRPPKSSKNKMFIFGLHSTTDDRPSNPSDEHQPKRKKKWKKAL